MEIIMDAEMNGSPIGAQPYPPTYPDPELDTDLLHAQATSFNEFMDEIQQNVFSLIRESSAAPSSAMDAWKAFYHAVDWTETWIRSILLFHVILLSTVILFRNNANVQCFLFAAIFILVRGAEYLNTYASNHWTEFSRQNYFDKNGVFTGTVFAAPLLAIAFLQLINFLVLTSKALITAKRLQLKRQQELKAKHQQHEEKEPMTSINTTNGESVEPGVVPSSSVTSLIEPDAPGSSTANRRKHKHSK
jgi:hypothetical protein